MDNEIIEKTPYDLISQVTQGGGDLAEKAKLIESLMDLQEKHERREAEKAYHKAVAEFKAKPIQINKDKANVQYGSMYTSISELVNTVNTALSPCGLSAHWTFTQADNNIGVTCILSHTQGHSESVTLFGPPDDSGKKNRLQQIKSTTTYLKGATFEAITGVASSDSVGINVSDDGNSARPSITEDQAAEIYSLLMDTGSSSEAFMKAMRCEGMEVADLPADIYKNAIRRLNEKKVKQA
jgi:hypothetical protein